MAAGLRLGIDFGTSHTVALLTHPDGRVRPLLFDGSPLLPSAVYANADGRLLTGRDAVHAARVDPARFEASPKRRIDDGSVLLGEAEYPIATLIAGVLSHVAEEARRVGGGPPAEVTLTHPASWGVSRRLALMEGAKAAGLGDQPRLIPEPVAAAHYFADVLGLSFAPGQGLLVYDFGGGTFDASMVVRGPNGFDVPAVDGIDDLGGLDLDALVVDYVRAQRPDAEEWKRLDNPQSTEDRRHRRLLWDDARIAKEMLSRSASATVHVPLLGTDVIITRDAFEQQAKPLLEQTVRTTAAVLRWGGQDRANLAGIFLVGGSSRVPLVATLLHRELGVAPTVIEQPEIVVAEGSVRAGQPPSPRHAPTPPPTPEVPRATAQPAARPVSPTPLSPTPPTAPVSTPPVSAAPVSAAPVSPSPVSPPLVSPAPIAPQPVSAMPVTPVSPPPPRPPVAPPPPVRSTTPIWPAVAHPQPQSTVYQASAVPAKQERSRRGWLVPVLAGLLVLAFGGAAVAAVQLWPDGGGTGGPNGDVTTTPTGSPRADPPAWLPAGFQAYERRRADETWLSRDEPEGGACHANGDAMTVRRDTNGLTGCTLQSPLDKVSFADVAIEAAVTVNSGCAGLWTRTSLRGYLLAVCGKELAVHRLGNDPPTRSNALGSWTIPATRTGMVVGLLAVGTRLAVYVDGNRLGEITDGGDDGIKSGKVNAGAYTGDGSTLDVVFQDFRIFYDPTTGSVGPTTTWTPRNTPATPRGSGSASGWPSPSTTRSASTRPTTTTPNVPPTNTP